MPKQAYKPAGIRESWRPDSANAEQRASRQRIAWRWVITALLALLFSAFGYLLFSPLFHPTLRLYHLTAGAYELLDIKPIPFFQEDAIRFLSIDGSFRKQDAANEFAVMDTPEAVRKYLQRIVNSTSQKSDVALLHISAHPMIKGERPFLKCSNFKPDALENGSVSVEEILDLLDRMSVGVTLVCLNLGPSDSQSLEDSVRDNFLFSLNDLMKSRKNPNQWVLVSNSPQEGSFASSQLRSSVFSYAVISALQGSGDFNRDAVIDLDEFSRFVVGFTKSYVRKESGGIAQQNPILIATSANADRALNLIAIASTPQKRSDTSWWESLSTWWSADPSKEETDDKVTDKLAEKVSKEKSWLTEYLDKSSARIQELTMDEIEDNINILPSFLGKQVKKSIGLEEELAESTYSKPQGEASPEEAKAASVDENAGSTNEESTAVTKPSERIGNSIPELSRLADPKSTNLQLLQLAWQYCEYFELPQERAMRPIDVAPHAWNEWITHLHGFEERLRMDAVADAKTIRLQLTSDIVGAYQFAMTGEARVGALAKRLSEQMPALSLPKTALPSIGLMEQLAEHGGAQVPKDVELQIKQLDVAIGMDTSESFEKWVSQLPRDLPTQYVEFFWPQQLASSRPAPWRITRRVVGLWRQYERLAYDPLTSNKDIQNSLVLSRRLLLEGTRQALDQIGADWIDRCLLSLDKAEFLLTSALDKRNQMQSAVQLRNQALAELRYVLRWRKIASTQLGIPQLDEELERALGSLSKLCKQLLDRESCDLGELVRNHDSLKASMLRIEGVWIAEANDLIGGKSKAAISTSWVADSLLATPFIRSPLRARLLALPSSKMPAEESEIDPDSAIQKLSSSRILSRDTQVQIRLESVVAKFAGMESTASANETLQIAADVGRFYAGLADQISNTSGLLGPLTSEKDLTSRLRALRSADQALRLLPSTDSYSMDVKPLESRLWQLEFLQSILREQNVTQECNADALPQEVALLASVHGSLSILASSLSQAQQDNTRPPSRLKIRGTSNLSLLTESQATGEVVLQNVGKAISNTWVLVDYDTNALEIQGPTSVLLHHVSALPKKLEESQRQAEQQLMLAFTANGDQPEARKAIDEAKQRVEGLRGEIVYPIHPDPSFAAPTMGLASGQSVTIPFKIRRVGPGPSQSKLIWKLVGDGFYVRHEVMVQLPDAEKLRLVVDGIANSWSSTHEGLDLFLWPNRPTDYRLGLRNDSGKARVLSVEMVSLLSQRGVTFPEGFLMPAASKEIEDLLGPTKRLSFLSEVALDSKQETVWLEFPPSIRSEAISTGPASSESIPPAASVDHGLVLVFTEKATGQKVWRRVATRVRHPRSYIEPTVRFDATAERAEIWLKAKQPEFMPAQGIEIIGRIVEPLPRGTEMKTEGTLRAGETLKLYCQVPNLAARELTFEIDVDGFPRAFVIKVPCWRTNADIPLAWDFQTIEFVEPAEGVLLGPNDQNQTVRLKIDAVPGAFETKRDYVEVGWDLDRDREFANETTFKFAAERQVNVEWNTIAAGRISMTARVDDIAFALPTPSLKNQRVNLLARLFAGGEMVWSKPIEIVSDSDPPKITGVEVTPGTTIPQGNDLLVRVGVDDARLSGIANVEIKVDFQGAAKFAESAEASQACVRESDGSWTLLLPTAPWKPGRATLFVRATDRVGNNSEESKTVLTILSEQDWQSERKKSTHDVTGTVTYSDDPLPNAKVTIEDEKGAVVQTTKSDQRGGFRIPGISPGKYKVIAIGVMKNRPRRGEQSIEVGGPEAPPTRLRIKAK